MTKKPFTILERQESISHNLFLKASAGTGKTFAIENLFIRLLTEKGFKIENLLAVTFTKAAAHDLKIRIRTTLEKSLKMLLEDVECTPDYLQGCLANIGIKKTQNILEEALFCFDRANIFTIHGFCFKMLQENAFEAGFGYSQEVASLLEEDLLQIVDDFFRTELSPKACSPAQLEILLKKQQQLSKLKKSLLEVVQKGSEIALTPSFLELFHHFADEIARLRKTGFKKDRIIEDFYRKAPHYKEICDKKGHIKHQWINQATHFADLFDGHALTKEDLDYQIRTEGKFIQAFSLHKRKVKCPALELHYPSLTDTLQERLLPLIKQASSPLSILAHVAANFQKVLKNYLNEHDKLEFSSLLSKMAQASTKNLTFRNRIQNQFSAVIIDEFQDTDPLQWKIFKALFLEENALKPLLYLVGDPKQSIYSFRSADIYTYLEAEAVLGKTSHRALSTNYRSVPKLVEALNRLFNENASPGWLPLPYLKSSLPYPPVEASPKTTSLSFKDTLGAMHFCLAEGKDQTLEELEQKVYFPYFSAEIKRLKLLGQVSYSKIAILVSDRFQMKRLATYFKKEHIPVALQRSLNLCQSEAFCALKQLLQSALFPEKESDLKVALGGKILGLNLYEIENIALAASVQKMIFLKELLEKKGFGAFIDALFASVWKDNKQTVEQNILRRDEGEFFLHELMQTVAVLLEYEAKMLASPERILEEMQRLELTASFDDEKYKIEQDVTREAIQVLTIFASKGLEFDIVFALGLIKRVSPKEELALVRSSGTQRLTALFAESEEYQNYLSELDAEKMRKLYVALTRAKQRVYIPCVSGWKPPKKGSGSPLELFLARLGRPACHFEEIYNRLEDHPINSLKPFLEDGIISLAQLKEVPEVDHFEEETGVILKEPKAVAILASPLFTTSFSSLAKPPIFESLNPPHLFDTLIKTSHTLPAGNETGNLLHQILENVSFQTPKHELKCALMPFIKNTAYEAWEDVLLSLLKNLFSKTFGKEQICLEKLYEYACFKEMEFLCPLTLMDDLPECQGSKLGFLNGIVDLVFMWEDKYYLLDWKSNWLGPDISAYTHEEMAKAMKAHRYDLQATIYMRAFKKYIKLHDLRSFSECFGGVIYIFLRGINEGGEEGFYHFFPEDL